MAIDTSTSLAVDAGAAAPVTQHTRSAGSAGAAPTLRGSITSSQGLSMEQLVAIKFAADEATLYTNHGFARGGVGYLVATGAARAGINRLPQSVRKSPRGGDGSLAGSMRAMSASATFASRATTAATGQRSARSGQHFSTSFTATGVVTNAGAPTVAGSDGTFGDGTGPTSMTAKEWEKGVLHTYDFQAATRRTRVHDIPKTGRFSGISFYENDPAEIKRHLDIVNALDQLHADCKEEERSSESVRHAAWADRQRRTFRRQRQELALKYQMLGLPARPAYAWATASVDSGLGSWDLGRPSTVASSNRPDTVGTVGSTGDSLLGVPGPGLHGSRAATAAADGRRASLSEVSYGGFLGSLASFAPGSEVAGATHPAVPARVPLPKPTFVKVYDRMGAEIADSPRLKAEAWRQAQAAKAHEKEAAVIHEELRELEGFEDHLSHIHRLRARSQYASASSHSHGDAE